MIVSVIKQRTFSLTCSNLWIVCFGFFAFSLLPSQAYYESIDNSHPLVICDSLNADIQSLITLPQESLLFPNALAESRCVAINTCSCERAYG